jgi:TRAP-type uncharacterized transport system substrate-binding protein
MSAPRKSRLFRVPAHGESVSLRDMALAWWPALLVVAIGFAIAFQFVKPAPPRSVVIVTGAEDGAYYGFAKRYREVLERNGIALEVRSTAGSVENYQLLRDANSGVDFGFVQGGIGSDEEAPNIQSLGSMYYEPVWVFYHARMQMDRLTQLRGKRVAVGPLGSGTRHLVAQLLNANGVPVRRQSRRYRNMRSMR